MSPNLSQTASTVQLDLDIPEGLCLSVTISRGSPLFALEIGPAQFQASRLILLQACDCRLIRAILTGRGTMGDACNMDTFFRIDLNKAAKYHRLSTD
jgi:hypothetical protein